MLSTQAEALERHQSAHRACTSFPVEPCKRSSADGRNPVEIRAFTVDQPYCFAIEAFNEHGVSAIGRTVCDDQGGGIVSRGQSPSRAY